MPLPNSWRAAAGAAAFALAAVSSSALAQQSAPLAAAAAARRALDPANLDTTCAACTDFFRYANGGWLKRTTIPAAYPGWGSFAELYDRNNDALREILDAAAKNSASASPATRKVGAFYASCTDSAAVERQGARPIAADLARIDAVRTRGQLEAAIARLQREGIDVAFTFNSTQDPKNSTRVVADASQGGLGLPDRDYYTKTDSASTALRNAYVDHIARTFVLLGQTAATARESARRVMSLETRLATAQMTLVEQRDPNNVTHITPVAALQDSTPGFGWKAYLARRNVGTIRDLNVRQPSYFVALDKALSDVPLTDWRTYLKWHVARVASPYLSAKFVNEDFSFARALNGTPEMLPRWKRCLQYTDAALGEALGQLYVEKHFTPAAKARAQEMVANLISAMHDRISSLQWMSDTTRQQALVKLAAFQKKIGYPEKWRDYSSLDVRSGAFASNVAAARTFEVRRQLGKIGKPVDRGEWGMSPPTVNAYYNPFMNEIVFPAGIMQPPFFDADADDAVNYGGMGAVIGHEISHGFDDQGRQFDAQGLLRDWWTAQDAAGFTTRAKLVSDQADAFVAVDTLKVNGRLTLGENLADLAGLTIAYAAFEKSLEGKPRPANIDGFTPEQRFFLGWAQIWRETNRPEYTRLLVSTDPHAPGRFRTNGPLSNMPEFARAWGCKPGDPMVRSDSVRAQIW
ncbi:MAG TPA: M13 family metallopeptidase [Gemmatimonadaceae bacterium]|nr:M13 family metallopeptidase [Gemmatimonadaceae bacterium]